MQDRKLPVTQLGHQSSKFQKAQRPHNKKRKTKYFKILGLLASIGATVSLSQPARATAIANDKGETIIAQLPSLDTSQKTSQSVALKNLSTIDSQSSTVSIKTESKRSPVTEIPQLPALEVARVKPAAERIREVNAGVRPRVLKDTPSDIAERKGMLTKTSGVIESRIHTVKAGETIARIARQYGVSIQQIIEANQLSNPNFISIDRQLVIPRAQLASDRYSNNTKSEATSAQGGASVADSAKPLSSLAEQKAQFREKKTNADNIGGDRVASPNGDRQITDNDTVTQNSYISKLRESIVELRTRYQNQSGSRDLTITNAATVDDGVTNTVLNATPLNSPSEVEAANNKALNSTSPSTSAENNSLISLSGTDTVTPALPPLASPEEYLPDNPLFDGYMWPAKGTLTSGYGWRWGRMHKGIDIAAPIGTPIMAAAPGEVIFAGWNSGGYGNLVKLQHSDGSVTFYAHNHRVLVGKGQKVRQGQLIAEMGSTGRSTGPHLHFEIRPNGTTAINPIAHLPKN